METALNLLGIAFGLIVLPKSFGFVLMVFGGILLIAYAFHAEAWVFFILNTFFAISSAYTWQKTRQRSS